MPSDSTYARAREEIISRLPPGEFLARQNIAPRGKRFPCPNPDHESQDSAPDLACYERYWKCHSCGARGTVFDLAVFFNFASNYQEALALCASMAGVDLPKPQRPRRFDNSISPDRANEIRRRLIEAGQRRTTESSIGIRYLASRCIDPAVAIAAGVADLTPPQKYADGLRKKFTDEELVASGLFFEDSLGGARVAFANYPLAIPTDAEGSAIEFRSPVPLKAAKAKPGSRKKPKPPPKSIRAGRAMVAFGHDRLPQPFSTPILVVEGPIDWLTALSCDVAAIGLPGAENYAQAVPLLAGRRVVVALDPDGAGVKAARELLKRLRADPTIDPRRITLSADLNDLARSGALGNGQVLHEIVEGAFHVVRRQEAQKEGCGSDAGGSSRGGAGGRAGVEVGEDSG